MIKKRIERGKARVKVVVFEGVEGSLIQAEKADKSTATVDHFVSKAYKHKSSIEINDFKQDLTSAVWNQCRCMRAKRARWSQS